MYIETQDLLRRGPLSYAMFIGLTLSNQTKHHHNIKGWSCICGLLPDGRVISLYDIWCGFNDEYLPDIAFCLLEFCRETGVELR